MVGYLTRQKGQWGGIERGGLPSSGYRKRRERKWIGWRLMQVVGRGEALINIFCRLGGGDDGSYRRKKE